MIGHHSSVDFLPRYDYPPRAKVPAPPPPPRESSWCSRCKCCTILFTFIGFVLSLIGGLCILLIEHGSLYFPLFVLSAIICLFLFIQVITNGEFITGKFGNWRIFQGGKLTITGRTEQADSIIALPARLVMPAPSAGQEHMTPSKASTESTLISDEGQDKEAGSSKEKPDVKLLAGEKLGEATKSVVKEGAEAAGEGSSELSEETGREALQGVRQRRQSPMKTQKHVPAPEDEKTK